MSAGPSAELSAGVSKLANISPDVDLDIFERRYLAHAASQLPGRDDRWLAQLAEHNLELGAVRAPGQTVIEVRDVDADTTVVDIITNDVPYLVDSLRAELERRSCPAERVLHPQIVVRRDDAGRLLQVYDIDDNAAVPEGATVESWTHIELDDIPADEQPALADDLRRVLADVHHAVEDAPAMYRLIRRLADRPRREPRRVRPRDERGGRRAAALARRRQLHDPGARRLLGQRAGQPARAVPRRRRAGRAARRRADLAARAAAGLPQRRAAGDLQVTARVDGAALGTLRLRHGHHARHRRVAADGARVPRPDHRRRGRHRGPGAGRAPAHRRDPAAFGRAGRQPHRPPTARRAAHPAARRAARGPDGRPAAPGPARGRPHRARHGRGVRTHPPQPRLRQRARLLPRRPLRAGDAAARARGSSRATGRARSSAATTASSNSGSRACSSSSPCVPAPSRPRPTVRRSRPR